eukprot:6212117-Pleurochrysis_carterae.AAC.3
MFCVHAVLQVTKQRCHLRSAVTVPKTRLCPLLKNPDTGTHRPDISTYLRSMKSTDEQSPRPGIALRVGCQRVLEDISAERAVELVVEEEG